MSLIFFVQILAVICFAHLLAYLLAYGFMNSYLEKNRLEVRRINLYPQKEKTMSDHMRDAQDIFETYPSPLFNWKGITMDDIFYVTEKPVRLQAIKVTRENIIRVAQWVGVTNIHIPTGPQRWYFYLTGGDEVCLGHIVIRDKKGEFFVVTEDQLMMDFNIIAE